MPQNFETYKGGPPAKGGSGADNYLNAIQTGSDQQSGALQFIGKVLEQSAALREQRATHEQDQQFQRERDSASRQHETALRQLIEEGWTSRKAMELDEAGAQADLNREEKMNEKWAGVLGSMGVANINRAAKNDEAAAHESARIAGEQFRHSENELSRSARWDEKVFGEGQANQRNAATNANKGGANKDDKRTVPGYGTIYDYDKTLFSSKTEDTLSPAASAMIDAAVDVKVAKYGGIDPPKRSDASKAPQFAAERRALLNSLGIGPAAAKATSPKEVKHVTSLDEIPKEIVSQARAAGLKGKTPAEQERLVRDFYLNAGYDGGDVQEPEFDPHMENSVTSGYRRPIAPSKAQGKTPYAQERDPIRRLFGLGPIP